jgi:hypothetical protein
VLQVCLKIQGVGGERCVYRQFCADVPQDNARACISNVLSRWYGCFMGVTRGYKSVTRLSPSLAVALGIRVVAFVFAFKAYFFNNIRRLQHHQPLRLLSASGLPESVIRVS